MLSVMAIPLMGNQRRFPEQWLAISLIYPPKMALFRIGGGCQPQCSELKQFPSKRTAFCSLF